MQRESITNEIISPPAVFEEEHEIMYNGRLNLSLWMKKQ